MAQPRTRSVVPLAALFVLASLMMLGGCGSKKRLESASSSAPMKGPGASSSAPMTPEAILEKAEARHRQGEIQHDCLDNCHGIGKALAMYVADHNQTLPDAKDLAGLEKALSHYLALPGAKPAKGALTFTCPVTGKPYLYNHAVAGKSVASCLMEILLKCSEPHADGEISVSLVCGICQLVAPSHPLAVRAISK